MNELIILSAKYLIGISVVIFLYFGWTRTTAEKKRLALLTVVAGIIALLLAKIAGHFVSDPRPFVSEHFKPLISHSSDNGFPSDHTLLASLLGFLVLKYSRKLGLLLLLLALAIGAARVAAGVHHPLDIAGAFLVSGLAVLVAYYALPRLIKTAAKTHESRDKS